EILANTLHTILSARIYRETPEWMVPLCAVLAASATVLLLTFAQGRYEMIRQLAALSGLVVSIFLFSYLAFAHLLIVPPLVPTLVGCLAGAALQWLRRSLAISADLDRRIAELGQSDESLKLMMNDKLDSLEPAPAALIAKLADADAAAIFEYRDEACRLLSYHGANLHPSLSNGKDKTLVNRLTAHRSIAQAMAEAEPASRYFSFDSDRTADFI